MKTTIWTDENGNAYSIGTTWGRGDWGQRVPALDSGDFEKHFPGGELWSMPDANQVSVVVDPAGAEKHIVLTARR